MRIYIILNFLFLTLLSLAQDTLSFEKYMNIVRSYHPKSKQADLELTMAQRGVVDARGNFDPKLFLKYKNKDFSDKEYYSLFNAGVEIPTITGIKIKGGYETNDGYYLNPEHTVSGETYDGKVYDGVSYIGVIVPLGKGMFTDENRQALKLAKINRDRSIQKRQLSLNDILVDAAISYWEWYYKFGEMKAVEKAYTLAEKRYSNVVTSYIVGESAAIDTVKAFVQKQDRLILLRETYVDWMKKGFELNNYIWDSTVVLQENLVPERQIESYVSNISVNADVIDSLVNTSPFVLDYEYKLQSLQTERRWKIEKLKPKINLEYNLLYKDGAIAIPSDFSTNYKWGVSASFPLFLRSERAGLQMNKIKIQDTEYSLDLKRRELNNKIKSAAIELETLISQYSTVQQNIAAYERLVAAEQTKFNIGESDLFRLNEWENKYQMALIKKAKMEYKVMKAQAKLEYLANTIEKP